jgi:hypothetical protein
VPESPDSNDTESKELSSLALIRFDRSVLISRLETEGLRYLVDQDDGCWVQFVYTPEIDSEISFYFGAEGESHHILSQRGYASRTYESSRIEEFLKISNKWNEERRWPKTYVSTDASGRIQFVTENQLVLREAITQEFIGDSIRTFITSSDDFWHWVYPLVQHEGKGEEGLGLAEEASG